MRKYVVYTVIIGNYDSLKKPAKKNASIDFICFTDNLNIKSDDWEIRYIENQDKLDTTRFNRMYKLLAHKFLSNYQYSFYIDGTVEILTDLLPLFLELEEKGATFALFKHVDNVNCLFKEAALCIKDNKDSPSVIQKQINFYKSIGIPENLEVLGCNIIFREHNKLIIQNLMEDWWNELLNFSRRDQISLPYVLYKNKFEIEYIKGNPNGGNRYFFTMPHKNELESIGVFTKLTYTILNTRVTIFEQKDIYVFGTAETGRLIATLLKGKNYNFKGYLVFQNPEVIRYEDVPIIFEEEDWNTIKDSIIINSVIGSHQVEIEDKIKECVKDGNIVISWRDLVYRNSTFMKQVL